MVYFEEKKNRLMVTYDSETLWLEAWGEDAIRVRSTKKPEMPQENWALLAQEPKPADIHLKGDSAQLVNGKIRAEVDTYGRITFYNADGKILLKEYWRHRVDNEPGNPAQDHGGTHELPGVGCVSQIAGREFRAILGGDYQIKVRFESEPKEKLFGMGQYQQSYLDLKNTVVELAQRNSQASVPFVLSDLGYGFLWNNPAVGQVEFCKNVTCWYASCSDIIDYWICAGDTPKEIEQKYASVTGTVPMMPEWAMGFWQSKLRYQTQDELLQVAREYKRRGLPIDVIVADYFHWFLQGDWSFDPTYWPDPKAMVDELKELGMELMVSIWPTIDYRADCFKEMKAKGMLLRSDRGFRISLNFEGNQVCADFLNPETRSYLWKKAKKNYYDLGIRLFWLDEAEPEFTEYSFDTTRNYKGPHMKNGNFYPLEYTRTFYDGLKESGETNIINLVRCAWAGSQRYGALVWSGDIYSSFESMRAQVSAGLNMGIAGIPWWTTDIGGFFGGDPREESFRELFARWFAYGTFCPVMRLHGNRIPQQPQFGTTGGATCLSGADNEVWSFGEQVYEICKRYLTIREKMKPYIRSLMQEAHELGSPVIRTLFYEFPEDKKCWEIEDTYLFGADMLVAPITEAGADMRELYLPAGAVWTDAWSGKKYEGGQVIHVPAPLDIIPVFFRDGFYLDFQA
ncbi:MAG: glycoside hydrolase family 31 protein [Eubacteriales bacterium]|nr:glycoside hydrolase family 31 protein [Eubacteriales bacterium]